MPKSKTRKEIVAGPANSKRRTAAAEETEVILAPVPRRKGKVQSIRLTSHKARSRWFQTRASWPVREAPVHRLVRERCDAVVKVPMHGRVSSLNVSVAVGVVLFEALRQRVAGK